MARDWAERHDGVARVARSKKKVASGCGRQGGSASGVQVAARGQ